MPSEIVINILNRIVLKSYELGSNIDKLLLKNIKHTFEKKCNKDGYIVQINNIKKRSSGKIIPNDFSGNMYFLVLFSAVISNPQKGDIINNCKIVMINKIGIFAEKDHLTIIITSRQENFEKGINYMEKYKVNQLINIQVLGKKFNLGDNKITILGKIKYYSTTSIKDKTISLESNKEETIGGTLKFSSRYPKYMTELGYNLRLNNVKNKIEPYYKDKSWNLFKFVTNPHELLLPSKYGGEKNKYGKQIPKVNPPSRAYFKMIEIDTEFNVIPKKKDKIIVANLAEGPGGFIKAIADIRKNKNDIYNAITLHSENKYLLFDNKLINNLKDILHISYGDLNNKKDRNKFIHHFEEKVDLVTADGGIFTKDFNRQEQVMSQLIFNELLIALSIQKKGGNFICKVFDMFTDTSLKIINLMTMFYNEIFITKPHTSRPMNSERYIICINFKGITKKNLKKLNQISEEWYENSILQKKKYIKLLYNNIVPDHVVKKVTTYNTQFLDRQVDSIKNTIDLIESMNSIKGGNKKIHLSIINCYKEAQSRIAKEWCDRNNVIY